jgi:hypothetical protein
VKRKPPPYVSESVYFLTQTPTEIPNVRGLEIVYEENLFHIQNDLITSIFYDRSPLELLSVHLFRRGFLCTA